MTWHWYVGRPSELLLDLDSPQAVRIAKWKLARNIRNGKLPVKQVHLYRSETEHHCHMIVTLEKELSTVERAAWELELRSDVKRAQFILMRIAHGISAGDFLIANRPYPGFRDPDDTCTCRGKHKKEPITAHCRVLAGLCGPDAAAEYFALRRGRRAAPRRLRLPVGPVPLSKIMRS